jgi:hypothetical protein
MFKITKTINGFIALAILVLMDAACTPPVVNIQKKETETPPITISLPMPVPANTPTLTPVFHSELSCWPVKPLDKGSRISGSLIAENNNGLSYWDINAFSAKLIVTSSKPWLQIPFVSPKGDFLTYFVASNKLTSISQNQTVSADLPPGSYFIDESLINSQLLIVPNANRSISSENYKAGIGFSDVYYVYNQKTGELTAHSIFLPKFTPDDNNDFMIAYSPDMRYVLYHSTLPDDEKRGGFILFDLTSQKIKWTLPESHKFTGGGDMVAPLWKPDASSLIYDWLSDDENKDQNFYAISLDGSITQITQFEQAFGHDYRLAFQPQWSPDMRYIAFRAGINSLDGAQLLIWDNKEKTLLRPCLPVDPNSSPLYPFTWSFDSEHIKVNLPYIEGTPAPDGPPSDAFREIILDIPNRVLWELPDVKNRGKYAASDPRVNYGILGWLNWEIP